MCSTALWQALLAVLIIQICKRRFELLQSSLADSCSQPPLLGFCCHLQVLSKQQGKATFTSLCYGHTHLLPFSSAKSGSWEVEEPFQWMMHLVEQVNLEVSSREIHSTLCFSACVGATLWLRWARDAGEPEKPIFSWNGLCKGRHQTYLDKQHRDTGEEKGPKTNWGKQRSLHGLI